MYTDDAGTLAPGQQKLEFVWQKDGEVHQPSVAWGISPIEHLEIGLSGAYSRKAADTNAQHIQAISLKWVPWQADQGWSGGIRLDVSRSRPQVPSPIDTNDQGGTLLATFRWDNGKVLHLNVGRNFSRSDTETAHTRLWAIGFEHPLGDALIATAEIHGESTLRPDKALGLRYTLREGLKISGAFARGNDRSFAQLGAAWEY